LWHPLYPDRTMGGSEDDVTLSVGSPPDPVLVLFVMARFTQQLKVLPVQRDLRMPDVLRRQSDFVMHLRPRNDPPGSIAPFTQSPYAVRIQTPAPDPFRRYIERMRESCLFVFLLVHITILSRIIRPDLSSCFCLFAAFECVISMLPRPSSFCAGSPPCS